MEINKRYFIIGLSAFFICLITIAIFHVQSLNKKWKREYIEFYTKELNGKLTNVSAGSSGTYFRLDNQDQKFGFSPDITHLSNNIGFVFAAEIGDSIIKLAYSDTLILIKKDSSVYKYTFEKYDIEF